jgi:hypothetical protein
MDKSHSQEGGIGNKRTNLGSKGLQMLELLGMEYRTVMCRTFREILKNGITKMSNGYRPSEYTSISKNDFKSLTHSVSIGQGRGKVCCGLQCWHWRL